MGYGEIVGGGPAGRYTLSLDYGEATKTATLAALNEQLAKLDVDLAAAQVKLNAAKAAVEEQRIAIADATNVFIAAGGTGNLSDTAVQAALLFLEQQRRAMVEAQKLTIDPQLKVDALRIARAQVLDYITRWNAAVTQQTKDAWCTDYTEDGGGGVATIDIDGEADLTLIAPGCRGWNESDGYMQHTQIMSPEGYFWNAAVMPGWQKWKPTYRWGTISDIDPDANTATVYLAGATSSQQGLNINQSSTLSNVPVVYMTCHASAFEEGDRVVVQFLGQAWGNPRVIGFLDNPKPCLRYFASYKVIGYPPLSSGNLHTYAVIERDKDEDWLPYTIFTPAYPYRFIQWADGNTSPTRDDGKATENISRVAQFTYAPNFRAVYRFTMFWSIYDYGSWNGTAEDISFDAQISVNAVIYYEPIGLAAEVVTPPPVYLGVTPIWTGQVIHGTSTSDAENWIFNGYTDEGRLVDPPGPVYLPQIPPQTNTITLQLSGSNNVYSVTGTKSGGEGPQGIGPGGLIYPSTSGIMEGATADDDPMIYGIPYITNYTATSWSATYA